MGPFSPCSTALLLLLPPDERLFLRPEGLALRMTNRIPLGADEMIDEAFVLGMEKEKPEKGE